MEPDVSKVEGDQVKREHSENVLAEERYGTCVYTTLKLTLYVCVHLHDRLYGFCVPGRADDDDSIGHREGDGDDGRRMMELELVEGSVTTAAAAALASAATKAKVKLILSLKN